MIRVNGELLEWTEGMTVQDMLNKKGYDFALIIVTIIRAPVQPIG